LFPADPVPGQAVPGVLDLPVRAPSLIQHGQGTAARRQRPLARLARTLTRKLSPRWY
jgi:hypothetical protein